MWEAVALRRIMSEFHLSGAELSRRSGVSYQQISKFRGGNEISRSNFVKIIKALPEKAKRWYLILVFDVNCEPESSVQLEAFKLTLQVHQLSEQLGVELKEAQPSSATDQIAALRARVDDLKEMLSQEKEIEDVDE